MALTTRRLGGWSAIAAIAIAGALLCAGCSSGANPGLEPTSAFSALVAGYLEDAESQGLKDAQVAVLERAKDTGAIAYEDYSAAIDESLDCITAAGFQAERDDPDDSRGFTTVTYSYEGPATGNPVAEACIRAHSGAIEALYQLQPTSAAAAEAMLVKNAALFQECLATHGITFSSEGKTPDEIREEISRLKEEEGIDDPENPGPIYLCFLSSWA